MGHIGNSDPAEPISFKMTQFDAYLPTTSESSIFLKNVKSRTEAINIGKSPPGAFSIPLKPKVYFGLYKGLHLF